MKYADGSHHISRLTVKQLVLGSTSPFRRALLQAAGVELGVQAPGVDETAIQAPDAAALARARARAKASAVAVARPECLVIGADQVLGLEGKSFDKAASAAEAVQRLTQLSGKTHYLYSAFCLAWAAPGQSPRILCEDMVPVAMPMRALSEAAIAAYVATGEWQGSVGCYQYENRGVHLFNEVAAEHSAIVGLPLTALFGQLRRLGIDLLQAPHPPWTIECSPGSAAAVSR